MFRSAGIFLLQPTDFSHTFWVLSSLSGRRNAADSGSSQILDPFLDITLPSLARFKPISGRLPCRDATSKIVDLGVSPGKCLGASMR